MNPLLFLPSPRDIPQVKRQWYEIKYDKFIVKYKPEIIAYNEAQYFLYKHKEYTHIIVCSDDIEVYHRNIQQLIDDVEEHGYETISGIMNLDESHLNTYAMQNDCDFTKEITTGKGSWIEFEDLPKEDIFRVDHSGFQCQIMERNIFLLPEFEEGYLDWQLSRICKKIKVPIMVDQRVSLYHRRNEQKDMVKKVKKGEIDGYSYWIQDR